MVPADEPTLIEDIILSICYFALVMMKLFVVTVELSHRGRGTMPRSRPRFVVTKRGTGLTRVIAWVVAHRLHPGMPATSHRQMRKEQARDI